MGHRASGMKLKMIEQIPRSWTKGVFTITPTTDTTLTRPFGALLSISCNPLFLTARENGTIRYFILPSLDLGSAF